MDAVTALSKSLLIAPAEAALQKATTKKELEDAWFTWCDGFADNSVERDRLLSVYQRQCRHIISLRAN